MKFCRHIAEMPEFFRQTVVEDCSIGITPGVIACDLCFHLVYGKSTRGVEALRDLLPFRMSGSKLRNLMNVLPRDGRTALSVEGKDLIALFIDGEPSGVVFFVVQTAIGAVSVLPADSTPWHKRIVPPNALGVGFGLDGLRSMRQQHGTIDRALSVQLDAGAASLPARLLIRIA